MKKKRKQEHAVGVKAGEKERDIEEKAGMKAGRAVWLVTSNLACKTSEDLSDPSEGRLLEAPSVLKTLGQRRSSLVHVDRRGSRSVSSS